MRKAYIKNFNPKNGKSLHFIGDFGNGKTSLGCAILRELYLKFNCVYVTWSDFKERWYYAKNFNAKETQIQLKKWIVGYDLVILDEFVINIYDEKEINLATDLLDCWYKDNKCFVLINNDCDISEMKKVKKLGKAFDRLSEQATKYIFEKASYRRQIYNGKYD